MSNAAKHPISLFLKGMCMGIADVIPGVSGGTLALVLGIYKEFVDTIRGLHLRWLGPLWRYLTGGREEEARTELVEQLESLNLKFLIVLVAGIGTAIVVGSAIIPYVLENFPVATRGFFFGLILASVYVPYKMIRESGQGASLLGAGVLAILFSIAGFVITNPANSLQGATTYASVTSDGETLKELVRRQPSAVTAEQVYWDAKNEALRASVAAASPKVAGDLKAARDKAGKLVMDKKALKARAEPYLGVSVPKGTAVQVPQPALWYIFLAGAVAICAMILPGISGSYILLIFGVYFFILNALKGMLSLLARGTIPGAHMLYVGVFIVALVVGILSFARVLSFLLAKYAAPTLGALVGLMLGCLRGIWPFRGVVDGVTVNVLPGAGTEGLVGAIVMFVVGLAVVVGLTFVGGRVEGEDDGHL